MSVEFRFVDRTTPMGATLIVGGATLPNLGTTGDALAETTAEGWAPSSSDALTPLGDETWGAVLAAAGEGTEYMLWVEGAASKGLKRDPYARELTLGAARVPMLADPPDRRSWYARSRSRAATALLFAAPGIPALFMGEEILEDKLWGGGEKDHPGHLVWWDGLNSDPAMADYLRFMRDLIALRRREPALRGEGVRVSRVNDYDRVIVVHRWVADGSPGGDALIVASFDENPKTAYPIGLPIGGRWAELFNSDFYDRFPNPAVVGNGGMIAADGPGLDGFAHSALIRIPPNGALILGGAGQ